MKKKMHIKNSYALIFIYVVEVILKAFLIKYFPSPWIFSDEQSYFGMAGKIIRGDFLSITNSHMPGYPLLISLTRLMSSTEASYKMILLFNIMLSSSVIFISFVLFKKVFELGEKESILYSTLVSLLPQFILYNYTIMSENLYIILFFTIVTLLFIAIDTTHKDKLWIWLLLGALIGFSPIVRSQSIILLIMFIIFFFINMLPRIRVLPVKKYMISSVVSFIVYAFMKFVLFANTTTYSDQREGYIEIIRKSLSDFKWALNFIQIFFGETSYLFAAILFVPTFVLFLYFIKKDLRKEFIFISIFLLLFTLANVLLTTLHADYVYSNQNLKTVYARYLDFIIPILFAFGIVAMNDFKFIKMKYGKKKYFYYIISLAIVETMFFYKDNLFVNTFTIYIYQYLGDILGRVILVLIALAALLGLIYNKNKMVIITITSILIISVAPALVREIKFSNDTFNLYAPIGYWFDKNDIKDNIIDIDKQDSYSESDTEGEHPQSIEMDYITNYSLLFWANFYNSVQAKNIDLGEEHYLVSSRLLPRKVLTSSGQFLLYDKTPQSFVELKPDLLCRTAKGFNKPEQDWIWMNDNVVFDNILIEGINQIIVEIDLKGFYPPNLDKNIEVFINGVSTGVQQGKENKFYFVMKSGKEFSVKSMEIRSKTWDTSTGEYTQPGKGLGLDIKNINLYLNYDKSSNDTISYYATDKLVPWKTFKNTGNIRLYEKTFVPNLLITPEMLSRYGTGFNGPEEDWNWVIGNGTATLDKIYFPDIRKMKMVIDLKGLWPKDLYKKVEVYVNDKVIGQQTSNGNSFTFEIERAENFNIDSIQIRSNTWDPSTGSYAVNKDGLGLDIKCISLNLLQ